MTRGATLNILRGIQLWFVSVRL